MGAAHARMMQKAVSCGRWLAQRGMTAPAAGKRPATRGEGSVHQSRRHKMDEGLLTMPNRCLCVKRFSLFFCGLKVRTLRAAAWDLLSFGNAKTKTS